MAKYTYLPTYPTFENLKEAFTCFILCDVIFSSKVCFGDMSLGMLSVGRISDFFECYIKISQSLNYFGIFITDKEESVSPSFSRNLTKETIWPIVKLHMCRFFSQKMHATSTILMRHHEINFSWSSIYSYVVWVLLNTFLWWYIRFKLKCSEDTITSKKFLFFHKCLMLITLIYTDSVSFILMCLLSKLAIVTLVIVDL